MIKSKSPIRKYLDILHETFIRISDETSEDVAEDTYSNPVPHTYHLPPVVASPRGPTYSSSYSGRYKTNNRKRAKRKTKTSLDRFSDEFDEIKVNRKSK